MEKTDLVARLRPFICGDLMRNPAYPLGEDEPLITGGLLNSFAIAQIGVFIERTFGVYIPDPQLTVEKMDTLNLMADTIQAAARRRRP